MSEHQGFYVLSSDWLFVIPRGGHLYALDWQPDPMVIAEAYALAQQWLDCGYLPAIVHSKLLAEVLALRTGAE